MKVLHINRNYVTSPLHQVMMSHLEQNIDVQHFVFAPTEKANIDRYNSLQNTEVCISKCFHKWDRLCFALKQHKILSALERSYDVNQFDCIHAYTLFTDGNCAMQLSKKYGIPYIVAVRSTDVNSFFEKMPFLRKRGIRIMQEASAICFLSKSYMKRVFDQYVPKHLVQELEKKSYIIPNGIDDFWFQNSFVGNRELHDPLRLIYAGRIDANKNIETTISAIEFLRDMDIDAELTVVGAVYDNSVYQRIRQCEYVHYHEGVQKETLIEYYRNNDIFVMPSFTESFGLVYVEAMSQGLPVIYTKGEGFDGQFPEGTVGFHVDPNSVQSIADGIERIIKSYEPLENNLLDASMKFCWKDIVEKYVRIYNAVKN